MPNIVAPVATPGAVATGVQMVKTVTSVFYTQERCQPHLTATKRCLQIHAPGAVVLVLLIIVFPSPPTAIVAKWVFNKYLSHERRNIPRIRKYSTHTSL